MYYDLILIRYGELALKSSKIRGRFERRLMDNILSSIDGEITKDQGRLFLKPKDFNYALNKLNKIFGIVSYSPVIKTKTTKENITQSLSKFTKHLIDESLIKEDYTFAIRARRVGNHNFTSQELGAFCGGVVIDTIPLKVDLTNPDVEIFIEVRDNDVYIYTEKIEGPGGLPLGTQGKVIVLLSSGIDSPVAAYLMMKRGCSITALHFDNSPFTTDKARANFNDLVEKLEEYSSGSPIKRRVVPYGDYLNNCIEKGPQKMTCVLCKAGMYKIAELLAKDMNALAIVDGSSVGQVASQTLKNILATRYGTEIPILSPLIGMDKLETTRIAEKIGTFEISKRDDGGCSAVPKYPETRTDLNRLDKAKEDIDFKNLIFTSFKNIINEK